MCMCEHVCVSVFVREIDCMCVRETVCESVSVCVSVCESVCVCVFVCAQSCLSLCNPVDCSPPDCSVHGIFQQGY